MKASISLMSYNRSSPKQIYPEIQQLLAVNSLTELAAIISNPSWAWSPSEFKNAYRVKANFLQAHFLALDYDKKATVEQAISAFKEAGLQFIVGTTLNHQKQKGSEPPVDRFRVVVPISGPLTNAAQFQQNLELLALQVLPFVDQAAAVDYARCFAHCPNIVHVQGAGSCWQVKPYNKELGTVLTAELCNKFYIGTPLSGEGFNTALYKAAAAWHTAGYDEQEFIEFFERFIVNPEYYPEGLGMADKADLATIRSAFKGEPRKKWRVPAGAPGLPNPGQDEEAFLVRIVTEEMPKYIAKYNSAQDEMLFHIKSYENKTVELVTNRSFIIENIIRDKIIRPLDVERATNAFAKACMKAWEERAISIDQLPVSFALEEDTSCWAYEKVALSLEVGETPAWDEFLLRCSSPDDFLAWVWSVYEMRHTGRQALWLYGHNGEDGKSTVLKVIAKSLKAAATGIEDKNLDTTFGMSLLYGKRFAVYADCLNTNFLMKGLVRNITTGDMTTIEFKGKNPISAEVYLRLAIASNLEPIINNVNAESSRLLLISVQENKSKSANWEQRLEDELPRLLNRARLVYKEKCPDHRNIRISQAVIEEVQLAAATGSEQFSTLFDDHFIATSDYTKYITGADLTKVLNEARISGPAAGRFREYLATKGVKKARLGGGTVYRYMELKGNRNSAYFNNKQLTTIKES